MFSQAGETFAEFVLAVSAERERQLQKWGDQRHPDGTNPRLFEMQMFKHQRQCNTAANEGHLTWRHILLEEVYEALSEDEPEHLKEELIQIATVILAWIEDIDSREEE